MQTVFLKLYEHPKPFESDAHLKHWLLRVTVNCCRDALKSPWRKRRVSWEETPEIPVFDRPGQAALYREVGVVKAGLVHMSSSICRDGSTLTDCTTGGGALSQNSGNF